MTIVIIAAILIVMFAFQGIMLWLVLKNRSQANEPVANGTDNVLLLNQMEKLERSLDARMSESSRNVNETMRTQQELIRNFTEEITSVKEIGRQTRVFAEQLQSLQDILRNPKQRGILGEYLLETVLKNVMPPEMYEMQHPFKNGEIVDAVVFLNKKLVPVY